MPHVIRPLNDQERKSALIRFALLSLLTLLLIPCIVWVYEQVPEATEAGGPAAIREQSIRQNVSVPAVQDKLRAAIQAQSNINIALLVDATPGMEAFLPAIAAAADAINESYVLNMVAACYRDASEGQWLYLSSDMSGQPAADWLRNLNTEALYDQDEAEAVYYGLKQTLQSEQLKKGESNILILIGDAGNHAQAAATEVAPSAIIALLQEKNCFLAGIQPRKPLTDPAFQQFPKQIREEILLPALQTYALGQETLREQQSAKGTAYFTEEIPFFYLFTPHEGEVLSPEELKNSIIQIADSSVQMVYRQIRLARDLQEGKAVPAPRNYDKSLLRLLKQHDIDEQDLQTLRSSSQ